MGNKNPKLAKKHYDKYNRSKKAQIARKKWYESKGKEYHRVYAKNKRQIDIQYKLRSNLSKRLRQSLNNKKINSILDYIGCSINELKQHLESKFQPGMTWDNYGREGWHIDHIKPLAQFDLSIQEQINLACHYTNLQPLWANDNRSKGKK